MRRFVVIKLSCPSCHKELKAREDLAGKRVKCNHCGEVVVVPAARGGPPGPDPRPTAPAGPEAQEAAVVATYRASPAELWKAVVDWVSEGDAFTVVHRDRKRQRLTYRMNRDKLLVTVRLSGEAGGTEVALAFDDSQMSPADFEEAARLAPFLSGKYPPRQAGRIVLQSLAKVGLCGALDKQFRRASAGGCLGTLLLLLLGIAGAWYVAAGLPVLLFSLFLPAPPPEWCLP
jgi:hypothetical protein